MIEAYVWVVDRVMQHWGYDAPVAAYMDDLLNAYLQRHGMEYVRLERL